VSYAESHRATPSRLAELSKRQKTLRLSSFPQARLVSLRCWPMTEMLEWNFSIRYLYNSQMVSVYRILNGGRF
jgi:hypothetical protein